MALQQLENLYFTEAQLEKTPSRKDGVDEAQEDELRLYGCDLIQNAGILLKLYSIIWPLFYDAIWGLPLCWSVHWSAETASPCSFPLPRPPLSRLCCCSSAFPLAKLVVKLSTHIFY